MKALGRHVLVTGGAGFIGSHVVELLCDREFVVTVIDDLRFGYRRFIDKRARFICAPLEKAGVLKDALSGVDTVIHLAGSSIIQYSYERPEEYFQNNVTNGIILLETMRNMNVKRIVFSSTSSVYGEPTKNPVPEDAPVHPLHPYAASKLAFEHALTAYYHAFGMESVILRYYNAYGPRDEQLPRTRAIPMWIDAVLKGRPVPWYWRGSQMRDYINVRDIAEAHLAVLATRGHRCYNVGSGKGMLMKDVLATLEAVVGKRLETVDLGERKGDPMVSYADIGRIKKEVGWYPKTSLVKGLTETLAYYRSQL